MYILLSPHNTCLVGEPVPLFKLEAHPPLSTRCQVRRPDGKHCCLQIHYTTDAKYVHTELRHVFTYFAHRHNKAVQSLLAYLPYTQHPSQGWKLECLVQ